MIDGYTVICATWMTNVVKNGYYPVTHKCLESFANTSFVDHVIVAEGQSVDDTIALHSDIPKVTFIDAPYWNTDELDMPNTDKQLTAIIQYVNKNFINAILVMYCADVIFSQNFRNELESEIKRLIASDCDFVNLTFAKIITKDIREQTRRFRECFHTYSAIKFDKDHSWREIKSEKYLIDSCGNNSVNRLSPKSDISHPALSYETFLFTEAQMHEKARKHIAWNESWTMHDIFQQKILPKLGRNPVCMTNKHPDEAKDLLDALSDDVQGHSFFDVLEIEIVND